MAQANQYTSGGEPMSLIDETGPLRQRRGPLSWWGLSSGCHGNFTGGYSI